MSDATIDRIGPAAHASPGERDGDVDGDEHRDASAGDPAPSDVGLHDRPEATPIEARRPAVIALRVAPDTRAPSSDRPTNDARGADGADGAATPAASTEGLTRDMADLVELMLDHAIEASERGRSIRDTPQSAARAVGLPLKAFRLTLNIEWMRGEIDRLADEVRRLRTRAPTGRQVEGRAAEGRDAPPPSPELAPAPTPRPAPATVAALPPEPQPAGGASPGPLMDGRSATPAGEAPITAEIPPDVSSGTAEPVAHLTELTRSSGAHGAADPGPVTDPTARVPSDPDTWGRVGRNEPCPCGSGEKFKRCHGAVV